MSMFDSAKEKVEQFASDNPEKVEQYSDTGIEHAGNAADGATGGKFSDKIDQGEKMADDRIGEPGDQQA